MEDFIEEVKKFFPKEDWACMKSIAQREYAEYYYVYIKCIELDIDVVRPDFMTKNIQGNAEQQKQSRLERASRKRTLPPMKPKRKYKKRKNAAGQRIQHKCIPCNYSTFNSSHFKRHLKCYTHNVTKRSYEQEKEKTINAANNKKHSKCVCTYCGQILCSKYALQDHIEIIHLKMEKYKCAECNFRTHRRKRLCDHMLMHE